MRERFAGDRLRLRLAGALLLVPAALTPALALATVDWTLDGNVGYDTNPGRVSHDAKGSASLYGGGTLTVDESRPRLDAKAGANLGYLEYLSGGYAGQPLGSLSADLRYALVPKTFFWALDERFGQGTANVLAPASPANRINVNTFSTGPSLVLPLNSVTRLQADARVGLDSFGGGTIPDDTRYTGSLAAIRQLSPLSTASLNGDYTKVQYRHTALQGSGTGGTTVPSYASLGDYDRENLFGRYTTKGKRDTVTLDVGGGRVNQAGRTFNSPLLRADWMHRLSGYWNLDLGASREYTDGAQAFGNSILHSGIPLPNQPPPGVYTTTQSLPLTNQPMRTDSARIGGVWSSTRTTFTFGAHLARDRFLIVALSDDNRTGGDVGVTRRLTPYSDLHAGAAYEVRQFLALGQSDKTTNANLAYNVQFDPSFQASFGVSLEKRDSTAGYSYTDSRIYAGLRYTPGRRPKSTLPGGGVSGGVSPPPR